MKTKINRYLVGIATLAILLTCSMVTLVSYELFRNQVFSDLKIYSELIHDVNLTEGNDALKEKLMKKPIRITIIAKNGVVLYDSDADAAKLENHADRPEVREAFRTGTGKVVRRSETFDTSTFYYAVLKNDYVIRVGKETHSIMSVFAAAIPVLIIILVILIAFCAILARFCTKSVLRPIEEMAAHMDRISEYPVYKEMQPFVQAIRKQHDEIIQNANIRQEFTANVSHELKTPLASISGYSELISNGMATGEDVNRFAAEIHRNAKRLLTLINDTLRLSQLDSIGTSLNFETVDLYEVAANCVDMLKLHGEQMGVDVIISGSKVEVPGVRTMIEEVIYNLCDNGIRYNKPGGYVKVTITKDDEYGYVEVADNGIGISEEYQQRVFERFFRVDKSRSKATGGTGLGLAIVKHIAMNHNACVEMASKLGEGTRIVIGFPIG